MTKLALSLSVELRTGMPVREERFFIRRAIARATLGSCCPFTKKWNDGPMESHPSPSLTEAGTGMTESGGAVWAGNPPLKINAAIKTATNILVFQFFISCFLRQAGAYAKNDTYRHTMFSQIKTTLFIAGIPAALLSKITGIP
jgi:hypothetical protein